MEFRTENEKWWSFVKNLDNTSLRGPKGRGNLFRHEQKAFAWLEIASLRSQ
jgi:hypothetical protein